jgi:hypothetical protein
MSDGFNWTCPFCSHDTIITEDRLLVEETDMTIPNAEGPLRLESIFIICPNPNCKRTSLTVNLFKRIFDRDSRTYIAGDFLNHWKLIPASRAQSFPSYIPTPIISDYNEACLICNTSPKASATLSRRCLQGILRDFWKVKPGRLVDEIEEIKDKADALTWDAIEAVRKIGNIGAHMEKDIDLIVSVDPNEAVLLIELIETLLKDWYIAREARRVRLEQIKEVAGAKDIAKKADSDVDKS